MTSKFIVPAIVLAVLFSGCNKKDVRGNGDGQGKIVPVEVKIEIDNAGTRAVQFPDGTPESAEKVINNIALFVFNQQKMLEVGFPEIQDFYKDASKPNSVIFNTELPVGYHYFIAVANVPKDYHAYQTSGLLLDNFMKEVLEFGLDVLTNEEGVSEPNSRGFLMTNLETPQPRYVADMSALLDAGGNKVPIRIGRAVAKVALAYNPTNVSGGTLEDVEYKMANNPSSMYLMPIYQEGSPALLTPNYTHTTVQSAYYQDPLDDYMPALLDNVDPKTQTGYPVYGNTVRYWTYIMENSNSVPKEGNSAMALIKGVFVPDHVITSLTDEGYEETSKTGVQGEDFYRLYTQSGNTKSYDGRYFSFAVDPADVAFEAGIDPASYQVDHYPGGVCYYPLWLRNSNSGNESNYTVKRNSYYKVTITSVAGAGSPDPDGGIDPEEPLDKETLVTATIIVEDWDTINDNQGI